MESRAGKEPNDVVYQNDAHYLDSTFRLMYLCTETSGLNRLPLHPVPNETEPIYFLSTYFFMIVQDNKAVLFPASVIDHAIRSFVRQAARQASNSKLRGPKVDEYLTCVPKKFGVSRGTHD